MVSNQHQLLFTLVLQHSAADLCQHDLKPARPEKLIAKAGAFQLPFREWFGYFFPCSGGLQKRSLAFSIILKLFLSNCRLQKHCTKSIPAERVLRTETRIMPVVGAGERLRLKISTATSLFFEFWKCLFA